MIGVAVKQARNPSTAKPAKKGAVGIGQFDRAAAPSSICSPKPKGQGGRVKEFRGSPVGDAEVLIGSDYWKKRD